MIYLPFQSGENYFKLLYASDVVMVKFGFLQILEALALHKPTIVLGEGGYVLRTPKVLDAKLQNVLHFEPKINNSTLMYFERLLGNAQFRKSVIQRIKKLHDGSLFGARRAAEQIEKLTHKKVIHRPGKKKVAILINDEIMERQSWLKREERVYPLCFVLPVRTKQSSKPRLPTWTGKLPLGKLNPEQKDILPHAFKHVFLFSKRKLDGLIDILPWYEEWLEQIVHILEAADLIYLTPQGKELFESFLKEERIAKKVRLI